MRQPAVVALCGSCISRDNFNSRFNPGYKRWFSCDLSANQASMIALMSPPIEEGWVPDDDLSDYDKWNVRSEVTREFLPQLVELQPDYLLLDFFGDVHFGVLRLEDGRYVTDNRWKLRRTETYRELAAAGRFTRLTIQDDTEEYVALWREAMDRFAAYVAEHCPQTTVVVARGFNTDRVEVPGTPGTIALKKHKKLFPLDVQRANELWDVLDDHAISAYGWDEIDLRHQGFTSYAEHPWGAFYVHFTSDFYPRFLAELHKIDLAHTADPEQLERFALVEGALREQLDRREARYAEQVAAQRKRIRRQRRRIEELEAELERARSRGLRGLLRGKG